MDKYDIAIIGGGPGGYPAAIRAAQLGASVALIEKEFPGGTCLNWGCIPTKTLIAASSFYSRARNESAPGLKLDSVSFDYKELIGNKNLIVARLRNGISQLLKSNGVDFRQATASFAGRNLLVLRDSADNESRLEAKYIVIAAGCVSALPAFLPRDEKIVESRAFLDKDKLPAKLIVLGGGIIGCEIACMAAQFGSEVTIVEILEDIMINLDKDLRAEVRRHMEKNLKIQIRTGNPLENIGGGRNGVKGQCAGKTLEADLLLCAAGRIPAGANLALEHCDLKASEKGFIETDSDCRTRSANIFAVGDINGKYQLAHAATAQGIAAVETALGHRRCHKPPVVPSCIFTAPEIGVAGISEQEAAKTNREIITGKFPFAALGKAVASGETTGFVKWIADPKTGQLLGAAAVGAHATELIAEATLAIQSEQTYEELGMTVHAHPTMAEAWLEAAHAVGGNCIHAPPRKGHQKHEV
ncbi:MAG: dihydrolipoyl dehydrogenase [Kiritimatiellia bacterium]|nr:dihydrolipoyl dehydrogenase [Kiritimatiellia bacterium]